MNKNVWLHGYASKPTKTLVFTLLSSWFSWMFIKNHIQQHIRYNRFWMVLNGFDPSHKQIATIPWPRMHLSPRNVWTWTRHFLAGDAPTLGLWIHRISAWCFRWRTHSFKCVFLTTTRPSVDSMVDDSQALPKSSKITFRKYLKIDNPSFSSHMIDWKSTNHKSMWHFMVLVLLFEHPVSKKNDVWWSTSVQ